MALLGVGLAAAGCTSRPESGPDAGTGPAGPGPSAPVPSAPVPSAGAPSAGAPPGSAESTAPAPTAPLIRANGVVELHSGPAESVHARQIALTVDDGYCAHCVDGYVDFAQRTGTHLTFSPNGCYDAAWAPAADRLRPLIESGQVQLMNHTFTHTSLTTLPPAGIQSELERNEAWIQRTFATTTRPYFRPPYGRRSEAVEQAAGEIGYTREMMWNGSYADSRSITPQFLLQQAQTYLRAGTIMLGHANHPTVIGLLDQILELIRHRELTPVTLDQMFHATRPQLKH